MDTKGHLQQGNEFPYDATDAWWEESGDEPLPPPEPSDWAIAAARGVIHDLQDRRGIKDGFSRIDEGVRAGIVQDLASIIRQARFEYR